MRLAGKVAIVTGAGRGIGSSIAHKLAAEGATVLANDLDGDPLEQTVAAIRAAGGQAHAYAGDVTSADFGNRIVAKAVDDLGGLDILVNNAGYIWNSAVHNHVDEQWYAMLDVHATAPFRILRAAAPWFRQVAQRETEQWGSPRCRKVVNISSTSGVFGAATQLAYSAGKAAVVGMTKTLAKEWGRLNVTVNCVAFGHIQTRLTQALVDGPATIDVQGRAHRVGLAPDHVSMLASVTPLGRAGTPEEAAGAVWLFCVPESDYITGEVVVCSGGLSL
jgi:3-oxoacyl-[acyl-carrier protein] reductase